MLYNKIQERKKWRESIMRKNNRHSKKNTVRYKWHSGTLLAEKHCKIVSYSSKYLWNTIFLHLKFAYQGKLL